MLLQSLSPYSRNAMVAPVTAVRSCEPTAFEYVCASSVSMLMRWIGLPVLLADVIHMFLPSADMRARAMPPAGPLRPHQTISPSASRMNGTALPVPDQYDVMMKPRFTAVAFMTWNFEIDTVVVAGPVMTV